ncbi:MAG TPA: carboxypeptidase regulatory-like domain-containing protein [Pyrinomonadaceae bacterium]|nr:carboxypeptidase regulatory-like domain-containing protein [Pyrinomonadaceae bacterium]
MKNRFRSWLAGALSLALLTLSLSPAALAQQPTGGIEGTVTDPQGAVVPNATVTARQVSTNQTRTTTTNDEGRYSFSQLAPDTYEVRATGANFKTSVAKDIVVAVGSTVPLDFALEVGGAAEEVTVVGTSEAQVDRVDHEVAGVVGTQQIQNLPLNGRNFLDLAQLQPGVETVAGGTFDPTKANYTGVSIAGQAGRSTQITVDGGSVVDNVVGTTTQNFSQEIVQEFQLGISNVDVSSGASGTGTVNVVSRSGTNEFHGNAYIYWRDDKFAAFPGLSRLDAANGIPPEARADRVPFDREQFGGTFGGPLRKDQLFFFVNYEQNNQDAVALHNVFSSPQFSGFTPNPFDERLFTTKVDWVVNPANAFFARYSFNDNFQQVPFAPGTGIVPRESASGIFTSNDQIVTNDTHGLVAGLTSTLTPKLTNQFIWAYNDFGNVINPATEGVVELRDFPDQVFRSGTNAITPQSTFQNRNQFRDDLTYSSGNHTFRFGGNYERSSITGIFVFANPGRIRFFIPETGLNTEEDFLDAAVRDLSFGIGDPTLPFNDPAGKTVNHRFQFYGNDNWKLTDRFTLNYGLAYRYDTNLWNHDQPRPSIIAPLFTRGTEAPPPDGNNWSPRVGFAWDVAGNGKTVLRGGVGIYYDTTIDNLRLFERADLGPAGAQLFLVGTSVISDLLPGGNGQFGNTPGHESGFITVRDLLAILPQVRAELEANALDCDLPTSIECFETVSGPIFSSDFEVPYSIQYAFGVQRELPWNMLLQADFNYRKGVHEVLVYDVNHADSAAGPLVPDAHFPVPYADSSAYSTYKALLLRLDRRFAQGFQMTASYSLSRLNGFGNDALGLGQVATDLNNLKKEFGPAALDREHRFVLSTVWDLPFFSRSDSWAKRNILGNWNVSLISTMFSGLPFSAFLPHDVDLSGTGTFLSYLPGTKFGDLGRRFKTGADLNPLIQAYNQSIPSIAAATEIDPDTGETIFLDVFGSPLSPLAELPPGLSLGGDSLISQDLRLTKRLRFTESVSLDLIGEVFNLFNVANYRDEANVVQVLDDAGAARGFLQPSSRATSVFGTGGPRAFQFAAKFRF